MSDAMLDLSYRVIVNLHIAAGTLALLSFWIAAAARKARGGLHARSGAVYLGAMRVILVTAVPMALMAFVRQAPAKGVFLLYLAMLVATTVCTAPRAVRLKHDYDAYRRGRYRFFAWALPASALVAFGVGLAYGVPLLWGFALVGLGVGFDLQRTLRRKTPAPGWWLREHYRAMLANGVGTHIAFLSIGLGRIAPATASSTVTMLAWFGPLVVALAVRRVLDRRHHRRFAARPRAAARMATETTANTAAAADLRSA